MNLRIFDFLAVPPVARSNTVALKINGATCDVIEVDDATSSRGFAAPRLTNDAKRFAFLDIKGNIMDSFEFDRVWPGAEFKEHPQMAHRQKGFILRQLGFVRDFSQTDSEFRILHVFLRLCFFIMKFGELFRRSFRGCRFTDGVFDVQQTGVRLIKEFLSRGFSTFFYGFVFRVTGFHLLEGFVFALKVVLSLFKLLFLFVGCQNVVFLFRRSQFDVVFIDVFRRNDGVSDVIRIDFLWGFTFLHGISSPPHLLMHGGYVRRRSSVG